MTGRSAPSVTSGSSSVIPSPSIAGRSEEHTSELQSRQYLVCRLLLEKKNSITLRVIPSPYFYSSPPGKPLSETYLYLPPLNSLSLSSPPSSRSILTYPSRALVVCVST